MKIQCLKIITILVLFATILTSQQSIAGKFSYTYFDAGYIKTDIDDTPFDLRGHFIAGSLAIAKNLHIAGEYQSQRC